MSSLNKVQIIGRLGKDPEIRQMQNGGNVTNLSIATSERWRDKQSGERKEKTEWHRVVIFNDALAKIAADYLRKGSNVYIEGKMQTRKWTDQQNVERYATEVVVPQFGGTIVLLDKRQDGGGQSQQSTGTAAGTRSTVDDDDIPY